MKKFLFSLLIIFFMIGASFVNQGVVGLSLVDNNVSTASNTRFSLATDIINGNVSGTSISYSYGNRTFTPTGNFTIDNTGTVNETAKVSIIQTLPVPLVNKSSIKVNDIIWELQNRTTSTTTNTTDTYYVNNTVFFGKIVPMFNTLISNGNISIQSTINITSSSYIYANGQVVGTVPVNATYYIYKYVPYNSNVSLLVTPKIYVVTYNTILTQVNYNQTYAGGFFAYYFNRYSVKYSINASEWFAQIKDGNREFLQVTAFRNLNLSYTELSYQKLYYYMYGATFTTLKFTNGTDVPYAEYPLSLIPVTIYAQNGTVESINIQQINMTAISTTSSVLQEFYAQLSAHTNQTQVNASSLVAWLISSTPRFVAYRDGNLNNQLDLQYAPNTGLQPTGGDTIPFIGISEAYNGTAIFYSKTNNTFDQHLVTATHFNVFNLNQTGVKQITEFGGKTNFGVGNVADASLKTYFNDPTVDPSTHVVTFRFGANYTNFPVTWVNTTDGTSTVVDMNIFYDYTFVDDPINGIATLSPTVTFGSLDNNPAFENAVKGLGLAVLYESDFLSLFALNVKNQQASNITVNQASTFASLSFSGPGQSFSSVNTTGPKAHYSLSNGSTYNVGVTALNLISIQGTAVTTNTTSFSSSETSNLVGSAYLQTTDLAALNFQYRKDIIVVSYPVWDGKEIVHDPTYSAAYTANPPPNSSSTTSSGTSSSSGASSSPPPPTIKPAPGFEAVALVIALSMTTVLVLFNRKRKNI